MKKRLLSALSLTAICLTAQTNYVVNFNGSTDYVDLGSSVATNVRSIELWFKPSSNITSATTGPTLILIGRNDATQAHEFGLTFHGSDYPQATRGQLDFYLSNNGNYYYALSNNNVWTAGTWYHVAGVIDPVQGMKLYINGVLQTSTAAYTAAIPSAPEITTLGRWGNANMRYFPGEIDEARLWDRAISQGEIQQKMCYWLNPANETGLIGYWKMNEGSGTVINDASTSAQNGAITGATFVADSLCFSGVLNVADLKLSETRIAPNPSEGTLMVGNIETACPYEVRNLMGEIVAKGVFTQNTLDLNHLTNGFYVLCLLHRNSTETHNIIISKGK